MEKAKKEKHLKDDKLRLKMIYDEKNSKIPIKNMIYKDDPPAFISIVGPKQSGKSTLLKSLVKRFTGQILGSTQGPITTTLGKDKRVTFFEVEPNIHQLIDASKVSDLVIFTIDATVGLEMETFEFIMLLIAHGMPKLLFVITNTDKKGDKEFLKRIKKRIWDEITEGLKFFHLSLSGGSKRYDGMEFLNLCRALSVMKYRPLEWKCSHPHIVVDKIDNEWVYGYIRGAGVRKNTLVHIPGSVDTKITDIEILEDPVSVKSEYKLSTKKKLLYAPMISTVEKNIDETESETEFSFNDDNDIKLFKKSTKELKVEDDESSLSIVENNDLVDPSSDDEIESESSDESMDFDGLKESVKDRFRKQAVTEEELIENFEKKYNEKNINDQEENFLLQEKRKAEALKQKNEELKISGVAYPGEYVRIKLLDNSLTPSTNFDKLIVLGVLLIGEDKETVLQGKVKSVKWHNKLLKTNEPLLFSVGWRRFQSIPVFSMKSPDKNRMLKYTAKGIFCNINFYGPIVTPGAGFAIYSPDAKFRVIGIGTIQDITGNHQLVKKLKLVGYPKRIQQNTAFIKDMFSSDLEVLKFKNARLNTVSGLKGVIKGPSGKEGDFRALFDNPLVMSDIVFLKCFVPFPIYDFFISVTDLAGEWKGLRSLKEIRNDLGVEINDKYNEEVSDESEMVKNADMKDKKFVIPPEIERKLPFDSREVRLVSNKIEIPISPEEAEIKTEEENILLARKEQDKILRIQKMKEERARRQELQAIEDMKSVGVRKSIVDNKLKYKVKNRRYKK